MAEDLGFSLISLGHHYLTQSAFFQPQSLLAYLAARTSTIRLGFGILLLPLLPPVTVAEELATLDVLSNGRLVVGVGAGYRRREFAAAGVPMHQRYARLEEAVHILRAFWSGASVTASGHFGTVENAQLHLLPIQPGGPPIWIAANGPRGLRRVAELGAVWIANVDGDDEFLHDQLRQLRIEFEALGGNGKAAPGDWPVIRDASVAATTTAALKRARSDLLPTLLSSRNAQAPSGQDPDDFLSRRCLIGTPETILNRIRSWRDQLGVTEVILRLDWQGDQAAVLDALKLIGAEIIPECASWDAHVANESLVRNEYRIP